MNPLYVFLLIMALLFASTYYLLRGTVNELRQSAAEHARAYAVVYVKGSALVMLAMFSSFDESFRPLTREVADKQAWWDWAILFSKPMAAGLAVVVAFLDRSAERAREKTNPPFVGPTA